MKNIFTITFFAVLIMACRENKSNGTKNIVQNTHKQSKEEIYYDDKISAIDQNEAKYDQSQSLNYSKEDGTSEVVYLLLEKSNIVRLIEEYNYPKTGNYGKNYFYFENGLQFASKEVYYDNGLKKPMFIERISYYDKKGNVIFTKEKQAEYEIDLDMATALPVKAKSLDINRALSVLNQEKEFAVTFQGTAQGEGATFLIVGENKPDGFTSALAIQRYFGDIMTLTNNPKKYIGTPLTVDFQRMVDEKGFAFQILIDAKIVN